jgi:hypothetical protein
VVTNTTSSSSSSVEVRGNLEGSDAMPVLRVTRLHSAGNRQLHHRSMQQCENKLPC